MKAYLLARCTILCKNITIQIKAEENECFYNGIMFRNYPNAYKFIAVNDVEWKNDKHNIQCLFSNGSLAYVPFHFWNKYNEIIEISDIPIIRLEVYMHEILH